MKKLFGKMLAISLVLALALSVVACGMADAMAPNGWYDTELDSAPDDSLDGENYTEIIENPFVNTLEKPDSYFSIDVNTASYPNIRRYIEDGYINFNKNIVRVEEMLNYFDYLKNIFISFLLLSL